MTPRPATNLLICHGVLSGHARWRERVVGNGRVAPEPKNDEERLARLEVGGPHAPGVRD